MTAKLLADCKYVVICWAGRMLRQSFMNKPCSLLCPFLSLLSIPSARHSLTLRSGIVCLHVTSLPCPKRALLTWKWLHKSLEYCSSIVCLPALFMPRSMIIGCTTHLQMWPCHHHMPCLLWALVLPEMSLVVIVLIGWLKQFAVLFSGEASGQSWSLGTTTAQL